MKVGLRPGRTRAALSAAAVLTCGVVRVIGEPRYHQQNYSYLIVGQQRAVLFDAG
ncbi:MAG: hypothetical protein NVS1B6_11530 [Steroidobacteraceae bacterium]